MSEILSISTIIDAAKLSQALCLSDFNKQVMFKGGVLSPNQPALIYSCSKFLAYTNTYDPANISIRPVANFLQKLCGKYFIQALGVLAASSGIVIHPIIGGGFNIKFEYVQGVVGTLMVAPYATYIVTDSNVLQDSVSLHLDGQLVPRNYNLQTNYSVSYSISGFTITFSSIAYPDPAQLLEINYAKAIN